MAGVQLPNSDQAGARAVADSRTVSTGNHRQVLAIGDPVQDLNIGTVFIGGQLRIAQDPTQLFLDTFDTGLDVVTKWRPPTWGGTGIAATSSVGATVLSGGTTSGSYSVLESQPAFIPDEPGWDLVSMRVNIENPVLTTGYRFWGLGTHQLPPTVANPMINGVGWEIGTDQKLRAVTYASGSRNTNVDLNAAGKQPTDSAAHKYYIYARGDLTYWAIDSLDNTVASFTTGAGGPDVNTLPVKFLCCSNGGTAEALQVNGVSVGDTARNNLILSDPVSPWRQAGVSADGALSVRQLGSIQVLPAGIELFMVGIHDAEILTELKRMNTYLSLLTEERVSNDDILELD